MTIHDFPNLYAEFLRRNIEASRASNAEVFEMLKDALADGKINEEEFQRLFDTPRPHLLINAPGGAS